MRRLSEPTRMRPNPRVLLFPADDPRPQLRRIPFRSCRVDFRRDPIRLGVLPSDCLVGPPYLARVELTVLREDSGEILEWFGSKRRLWFVFSFDWIDFPATVAMVEVDEIDGRRRGERSPPLFPTSTVVEAVLVPVR